MKSCTMFSSSVVETDEFLALPLTTQAFYFHLSFFADSMGALDSLTIPLRVCGASQDDLDALLAGGWLIEIGGVTFVRDWLCHNTVREKDRRSRHYSMLKATAIVENGEPYRLKRGSAAGTPWVYPGCAQLNNEVTKERSKSETAAPAGAGGGSAAICPECGDALYSGHCFRCNFTAPSDTGGGGE